MASTLADISFIILRYFCLKCNTSRMQKQIYLKIYVKIKICFCLSPNHSPSLVGYVSDIGWKLRLKIHGNLLQKVPIGTDYSRKMIGRDRKGGCLVKCFMISLVSWSRCPFRVSIAKASALLNEKLSLAWSLWKSNKQLYGLSNLWL